VRKRLLPQAEETRQIAGALFEEGATGLLQFLDARRAFNEVRLRYHQILFDYHVGRFRLEKAMGAAVQSQEMVPKNKIGQISK
jgi:outer membrane protein TolC